LFNIFSPFPFRDIYYYKRCLW